jgi:peptidyl-prolyl cis-trans isomerase C
MTFFRSLILFGAATVLLGQTPSPANIVPPKTPEIHLSVDNPIDTSQVPPDKVVITVGDIKITAAQFDALLDSLQPQMRNAARGPGGRRQLADNIVKMLTLAQEAEKRKLDATADYKAQLMFQGYNLLANTLATQISADAKPTDADLHQYYDTHKNEYETVHARHILIRFKGSAVPIRAGQQDLTDDEAKAKAEEIRKKLQDGADFAAIAKAESDDAGSGATGGELPPFKKGQMVAPFETAAFAMKPGELSEPVKSQFGYHVIFVVSHDTKAFEEVRPEIEKTLQPQQGQKAVNKVIDDLEKTTPPVLDPQFFPPAPPPMVSPMPIPPPPVKK